MRLNGKAAIMAHLGKRAHNTRAWYDVRAQYGHLIYCKSRKGGVNRGYWALSEDLDQYDKTRYQTVMERDLAKIITAETTRQEATTVATAMLKRTREAKRELVPA